MGGDNNRDLSQETKPSDNATDSTAAKLAAEGQQRPSELPQTQADTTAKTTVANEFGSLQITGLDQAGAQQKADASKFTAVLGDQPKDNPVPQQKDGAQDKDAAKDGAGDKNGAADKKDVAAADKKDAPADAHKEKPKTPEEKAKETSDKFEAKGQQELADAHKNLKTTTDGSPPKAFEPQDHAKLTAQKTADDIAKEQLGPNATKDQLDLYARELQFANKVLPDQNGVVTYPAGSELKLPGQTADGGIVTRDHGTTSTKWADKSELRQSENGIGSSTVYRPDGSQQVVAWNRDNAKFNQETNTSADGKTMARTNSDGVTTETKEVVTNARTGDTDDKVTKISNSDDKGRTWVQEFDPPGSDRPKKVTVTNADKTQTELTPARDGTYVSADGKTAMTGNGDLFTRSTAADGSVTRTYEDGSTDKYDSKNHLVQKEFKDDFGRPVSETFKPGENKADTIKVTPHPGETPLEFKHHGNKYTADSVDASGKKTGTVEIGNDGRLVYTDDKTKSVHTETKDGTKIDIVKGADGTKASYVNGAESQVVSYDKKGHLTEDSYTGSDGSKFTKSYTHDGKTLDSVKIEDKAGGKTVLKLDEHAQAMTGDKTDASGKVVEHVTLLEDKLVFTDVNTGAVRAERYVPPNADSAIPHMVPGQYDKNSGTFTYENDKHEKVVESFAPGRKDTVSADGTVEGTTSRGDKSEVKPDGEAKVTHTDNTGVRLNADGTIDRWGPNDGDNANKEKLSTEEDKFLKAHADADKRDLAEIHRRLGGDTTKLDNFYTQLEKVDTANNLNDAEKAALRKDIMHHVANPEEIYQGRSPSCNVTVIERDMAMNTPDKYAQTVVSAVSDGKFTTADGTKVPLDTANLKMADASGRDLASRIFQTTTLQSEFYPRREYRNTEDGVGRLYPVPYNAADKPDKFEGLNFPSIADARHRMTGEQEGIATVKTPADLVAAFHANGDKPMTIAVDGHSKPFNEGGPVGTGKVNHVVTITKIDTDSKPPKVYVENQWGLKADHSTSTTAIDATELLKNMKVGNAGMVLTAGDYNKAYDMQGGKPVVNAQFTKLVGKAQATVPGQKVI